MCGINGIYNIRKLEDPTSLRGPDYTGVFKDDNGILGHNKLSIIDLQESSNQTFISNDGNLIMVFKGEI